MNFVYQAKLYFISLHSSHLINTCISRFNYSICNEKHYIILHFAEQKKSSVVIDKDKLEEITKIVMELE